MWASRSKWPNSHHLRQHQSPGLVPDGVYQRVPFVNAYCMALIPESTRTVSYCACHQIVHIFDKSCIQTFTKLLITGFHAMQYRTLGYCMVSIPDSTRTVWCHACQPLPFTPGGANAAQRDGHTVHTLWTLGDGVGRGGNMMMLPQGGVSSFTGSGCGARQRKANPVPFENVPF